MCSTCNNHPSCPVCGEDRNETCEKCQGHGVVYYEVRPDQNDVRVSIEEYEALSENERDYETCPCCCGDGVVEPGEC